MSYLSTPLVAAAPAPAVEAAPNYAATVAATAAAAPASGASWFTDPTQGLITGWPNWMLLFGGFAILMLIRGRGR